MAQPSDTPGARRGALAIGALVLVLAAALRIYGLRWGLPNALHDYSYHPDEFLIATAAFGSVYVGRSLNPGIYTYPSLFIYLSALAIAVAFGYGAAPNLASVYLAARAVTVVTGVAAVGAAWWAGGVLFGPAAGLLAAVVLAVAPLHVQHSHFATVDVPSTLFVALALGFSGLILRRGTWRDYILAGVMSGLAAGTKYNAGLVLLAPIAAFMLAEGEASRRTRIARLAACIGCAVGAFVLSTPGSVLWPSQFLGGLLYEARHAATGHGLLFAGRGSGFVHNLTSSLWHGLGPALAVLFVLSVAWTAFRRDRRALVVLAFVVPYYILISLSQVRFARYALPMFPAVAVLVGWMIHDLWALLTERRQTALRWLAAAPAAGILLWTLAYSVALDSLFTGPDPRDRAARWIASNVDEGSRIGVPEVPWFYSPPLTRSLGFGTLPQRQGAAAQAPYELVVFSDCEEPGCWWAERPPPEWVIVSDYEVEDALRLTGSASIDSEQREQVLRTLTDLNLVDEHYDLAAEFGHADWTRRLPHDMRYASPTITIYKLAR